MPIQTRTKPIGKRDANKAAKTGKIIEAARESFLSNGFDATTTSQIAAMAGISKGTLFLYFETKEDLLIVIFMRELVPIIEHAQQKARRIAAFEDRFLAYFDEIASYHEKYPELGRAFLRDLFYVSDKHREAIVEMTARWQTVLEEFIKEAQASGELAADIDVPLVASVVVDLFTSELRRWMGGQSDRDLFFARMRQVLPLFQLRPNALPLS